jgi:hypothetical protein
MANKKKYMLIILTASLIGCGNGNISKGDSVKHLTDSPVSKISCVMTESGLRCVQVALP